ncbi:MAG: hypothetical protein BJ554DRAFT_7609 [Olpidium bornovanus]|uniref:Uncharacterized protein n=1 Tax=Olpidium bornovanus TaxID=278681 RepID=A0A8H7ZW72_9FUNG|nr:MAG: hypothetical protein BJ554DRAFT_7609 [Olpidium bornovanus]
MRPLIPASMASLPSGSRVLNARASCNQSSDALLSSC